MVLWGLAAGVMPLLIIFSDWLSFADYSFHIHWILKFIGVSVFILSIWLLNRSHIDLGKMWSLTVEPAKNGELVTAGVYRRIRHPMYTAHVLWGAAQLLFFNNYLAGPSALLLFIIIIRIRVPREEQTLVKKFGDDYKNYTMRTGRFFPRIYR
jgi:protein-S-isoprenylcysteine O-methyltransferase Ste14